MNAVSAVDKVSDLANVTVKVKFSVVMVTAQDLVLMIVVFVVVVVSHTS